MFASNIQNYFILLSQKGGVTIDIIDKCYNDAYQVETHIFDYAAAVKQGAQMVRSIMESADPFGVAETIGYVNDKVNEIVKSSVDNAAELIDDLGEAIKNLSETVVTMTNTVKTLALTVDQVAENVLDLTEQAKQLNDEIIGLGEAILQGGIDITESLINLATSAIDNGTSFLDFLKKYGMYILIGVITIVIAIILFFLFRRRKHD